MFHHIRSPEKLAQYPIIGLAMLVFGGLIFGVIAYSVVTHGPLLAWDVPLAKSLHATALKSPGWVIGIMIAGYYVGGQLIGVIGAVLGIYFVRKRCWRELTMLANILKVALLLLVATTAFAQSYPSRPVRVIAAQSAGSSLDTIVRIVANKLSETTGQQFVIDNRGGAAGTIGIELGARAAPDGYTLTAGASSSMIVSKFTYRSLAFDAFKDFDPISLIVNADAVMVVHPSVPAKSVKEFIALAKAQPGKVSFGVLGGSQALERPRCERTLP
jgi:hypothetical protein